MKTFKYALLFFGSALFAALYVLALHYTVTYFESL